MNKTRVRIFYPADPSGVVPGGVDAFLRGLIKWAPEDIEISLVGATTDRRVRPIGAWSECLSGSRSFQFFPVTAIDDPGQRTRIPLSLRYTASVARHWRSVSRNFEVLEFHRIEPALIFLRDHRPKSFVFHTDMSMIRKETKSDVVWRRFPDAYGALERLIVRDVSVVWCVSSAIFSSLQASYPALAEMLNLLPNWVDTEIFHPLSTEGRKTLRQEVARQLGANPLDDWILFVGRLDTTKDPELLLDAFKQLSIRGRPAQLLFVGDGRLRSLLEQRVSDEGLATRVLFAGLRSPAEVARILSVSDAFALTSAYEGLPIAVLEALGCGVPVATTDVGDVRRVVLPGRNGAIASDRSVNSVAATIDDVLRNKARYGGAAATEAISAFHPAIILKSVYDRYRELAADTER